ncbi:hypothetical protein COU54_03450 [Candidatus Pacearchaeota archaeon CG10_big_fil_rev_8_21_14_0_10_31_24]|nr:MAG: hypothetical protein COU54_03450 [Candidatus Pacearchaeota archaeon CG10_big_fil_rev_8_21_14_0_10_31_24]
MKKKKNAKSKDYNLGLFGVYKKSFNYIYESRNYIYTLISLFILSGIIGFFFSENLTFLDKVLEDLVEKTLGMGDLELTIFIFFNNSFSSLYGLFFGIFLGIFPIIVSVMNGAVIGYVLQKVYLISGFSDFWRLLPHGIFELPAVFISLGLGLKLGMFIFAENSWNTLKERLRLSLLCFLLVVLPLLVVAAIIEGILIAISA